MLETPARVARNSGAGRVCSGVNGPKSAFAPVRAVKFKKQRRAHGKYVRPKGGNLVRQNRTCIRACFDDKDIKFDIHQQAGKLMEMSSHSRLPEQDEAHNGLHLWTLKRQANAVSI